MSDAKHTALAAAVEALESIALAGMSGSGQESEEGLRDWHARRAWEFIGIAARALEPARAALRQGAQPAGEVWTDAQVMEIWIRAGKLSDVINERIRAGHAKEAIGAVLAAAATLRPLTPHSEAPPQASTQGAEALRAIEEACNYSPHRDANTWDEGLAKLIHHHARLLAASPQPPKAEDTP